MYARMTFVLGHELGYMAEDDYGLFKTFVALDGEPEQVFSNISKCIIQDQKAFSLKLQPPGGL